MLSKDVGKLNKQLNNCDIKGDLCTPRAFPRIWLFRIKCYMDGQSI